VEPGAWAAVAYNTREKHPETSRNSRRAGPVPSKQGRTARLRKIHRVIAHRACNLVPKAHRKPRLSQTRASSACFWKEWNAPVVAGKMRDCDGMPAQEDSM